MNLYYNGVDIYGDVSVNYCVHEMFAEKQADTLVIRFNDTKGTWSKWQPAEGDTVQFKEGASDTGKMFVHSMKPENGLFTIRAMSMPKSGKTKKSKSWEGVRFLQLANEFAGNHGLTFQNYGCVDQVYPYIKQDNETDFALFRFNDTKGTWSKWQPAEGDTVQFKEGASDTGKMFVHSMKPENGLFTIRAMSMPKSGKTKKSKSWEGVRFLQLANEFAGNHGLTFQNYGCVDQVYPYIKQDNETDFALFHRLCTLEGCQMLIFDGKLLAYNEQYIEGQTPAGSLSVDENGVFSYEDNRDGMYGSCEIASGSYSGKFIADSSNSSVLRPAVPVQVTSNAEAARFAKGLLRNANKFARSGYFSKSLMTGYAAASILTLSTPRATMWDGTVFVYKVRHDFVGNKSTIYFRHILEGY